MPKVLSPLLTVLRLALGAQPFQQLAAALVARHVVGHDAMQAQRPERPVQPALQRLAHEALTLPPLCYRVAEVAGLEHAAHHVRQVEGTDHFALLRIEHQERIAAVQADGFTPIRDGLRAMPLRVVALLAQRLPWRQVLAVLHAEPPQGRRIRVGGVPRQRARRGKPQAHAPSARA
jgi:hypothetical protein